MTRGSAASTHAMQDQEVCLQAVMIVVVIVAKTRFGDLQG